MIKGRIFKNEFAGDLNELVDSAIYFDRIKLIQFVSTIDNKIDEDNKRLFKILENEDPENASSILNQLDNHIATCHFQDLLLKSLFIGAYSFLEINLKEICNICSKHNDIINYKTARKKKFNKYSDIAAPKHYLSEIFKLDISSVDILWNEMIEYSIFRKFIVHYNSEIEKEDLPKYFNNNKYIDNEFGLIKIIDKNFVIDFVEKSYLLLKSIVDLINDKYGLVKYSTISDIKEM